MARTKKQHSNALNKKLQRIDKQVQRAFDSGKVTKGTRRFKASLERSKNQERDAG